MVEVCGSSPHGPTISFNELASITSLGKAPIGSIKDVVRNCSRGIIKLRKITIGKDFGNSVEVLRGIDVADRIVLNPPDAQEQGELVAITAQDTSGN